MKTFIQSAQKLPRTFSNPLSRAAQPLFFALAFLPSILHLIWQNFPVINPFAALGPVLAGFWFAATVHPIRLNFMLVGTLITTALWAVNWLMFAGGTCCLTPGYYNN